MRWCRQWWAGPTRICTSSRSTAAAMGSRTRTGTIRTSLTRPRGSCSVWSSRGGRFSYVYDFGDNWTHQLTVEKIVSAEAGVRYPRCVAGQGACPPEDVGGPWGYEEFQAALTDPSHPEHDERLEWAGGPFDPHHFDLAEADRALQWLAWRPLTSVS